MEYIIEIGDPQQRESIEAELTVIVSGANSAEGMSLLKRIIIPQDFDIKINELQNTTNYISHRGVDESTITAMAKTVYGEDGISIVLSSSLYTGGFDTTIRYFVLMHEVAHVRNNHVLPKPSANPYSAWIYLTKLYSMYDEYRLIELHMRPLIYLKR